MLVRRAQAILISPLARCALAGAAMVLLRLGLFEYPLYFQFQSIPNHDMYQGAGFFATNLHSMRLSGDLAWWAPQSLNGYAQYFQVLLSPLAPTQGHISFFVWCQVVHWASWLHLAWPEYVQYLAVNYLLLPWLCFSSLCGLATILFRSWWTRIFVLLAFTLSGLGLWLSAWFYFQEHFTLFFLLASLLLALRRPVPAHFLLALSAILIQWASFNYWTVYNSWFIVIFLGGYLFVYSNQGVRLSRRLKVAWSMPAARLRFALAAFLIAAALWGGVIGSALLENQNNYVRSSLGAQDNRYGQLDARNRAFSVMDFLGEMFSPFPHHVVGVEAPYMPMHRAQYLTAAAAPLLLVLPFISWGRRERWLFACGIALFLICLASPFAMVLWNKTPGMEKIVHVFRFYTHHFKLIVLFLAAAALDRLLEGALNAAAQERIKRLLYGVILGSVAVLVALSLWPGQGPAAVGDLNSFVLILLTAVALVQFLTAHRSRYWALGAVMLLILSDLSAYFVRINEIDNHFTNSPGRHFAGNSIPLSPEVSARFRRPWPDPNGTATFDGGIAANMPVSTSFWPVNSYFFDSRYLRLLDMPTWFGGSVMTGPDVRYYRKGCAVRDSDTSVKAIRALKEPQALLLLDNEGDSAPPQGSCGDSTRPASWTWGYNATRFQVNAPGDGWLFLRQTSNPGWNIELDGRAVAARTANIMGTAFEIPAGNHTVSMEFMPWARRFYWPAVWATELLLLFFLWIGRSRPPSFVRPRASRRV